jgi:hypothetical protein
MLLGVQAFGAGRAEIIELTGGLNSANWLDIGTAPAAQSAAAETTVVGLSIRLLNDKVVSMGPSTFHVPLDISLQTQGVGR